MEQILHDILTGIVALTFDQSKDVEKMMAEIRRQAQNGLAALVFEGDPE